MATFLLFELATGYALFERIESEDIGEQTEQVQKSMQEFSRFAKVVKLKSFLPFSDSQQALDNANDCAEGTLNPILKNFLEMNFPKAGKSKNVGFMLGISEEKLGVSIQEEMGYKCQKTAMIQELFRGIRLHISAFVKELKSGDLEKAQLGLAHSYSRSKVKFNVNKQDNMVIQAISLLDQLDKALNTFTMRCREWYSWHFPELSKIITDNYKYAQLCRIIKNKDSLSEESLPSLEEITENKEQAQQILEAARSSMGTDINSIDLINIERFSTRVIELAEYRQKVHKYLLNKMGYIAPNLSALIGEQVGARLISHAGSLTNLAKYPASTVQVLGAEKALFRALKTKSNTPKYGLIFHSSFIGRASPKNKGRISRYLANKCTIAARIDSFTENSHTSKFGEKLKEQVEERLKFYDTGIAPKKNIDVMKEVIQEVIDEGLAMESKEKIDKMDLEQSKKPKKPKKSKKLEKSDDMEEEEKPTQVKAGEKKQKRKKSEPSVIETEVTESPVTESQPEGKKKKKKKEK